MEPHCQKNFMEMKTSYSYSVLLFCYYDFNKPPIISTKKSYVGDSHATIFRQPTCLIHNDSFLNIAIWQIIYHIVKSISWLTTL